MSKGNVPPRSHDANSADSLAAAQGQLPLPSDGQAGNDDWETVAIVGMPPLSAMAPGEPPSNVKAMNTPDETVELQSRIGDLKQCNEALLSRVQQLEEALERSQQALQQEVERSPRLTEEEKVAVAQTRSVAQLLSELDEANAALKRQTLLANTLSAQLKTAEDRAQRLEQEGNILRKRKTERAQQLQVAEDTCADLRSRLQRQQQYTLQFKSALEKCLDTTAFQHASHSIEHGVSPASESVAAPSGPSSPTIGMPRSESIRPWSAHPAQAATDPQLYSLLQSPGARASDPPTTPTTARSHPPEQLADWTSDQPAAAAAPEAEPPAAIDRAAEQQLWQDVERVMEKTVTGTAPAESAVDSTDLSSASPEVTVSAPSEPTTATTEFTEPIPWGAPVNATPPAVPTPDEENSGAPAISEPISSVPAFETLMTEPEPPTKPKIDRPATSAVPALEAMQAGQSSPSPLVHPLRPSQRKRKSLSAVELPNFPPLPKVPTE
ncbi:hypothetical protein [Halomicronema sp. CCY15110]|uniref:hypothetical protein n=1 Tax=Halomicronema sp. CCY15110 TaxID=2767773 RepID=UPI0019524D05|nr:hypothetical protein [Halomicronema sp. CCY15110]